MKGLLDDRIFRLGFAAFETDAPEAIIAGGGGSAMPCGFVFPVASAKLDDGEAEPLVRVVAESN